MNQSALCSPDPKLCFKYPQHVYTMCRKFFRRTTNNICKSYYFYIFGRSGGCRIFWQSPLPDLQMLFDVRLKNFLHIFYTCCRYLKHNLVSEEHNAFWFMIVWYFNQNILWKAWHTHYFFMVLICPMAVEYSDKTLFFTWFFNLVAL